MRIFVDADACPVKEIIVELAKAHGVPVTFVVSFAGYFDRGWDVERVVVDTSPQSVDIALINRVEAGDIVVTQDYGLASLAVGKGAKTISPSGKIFHDGNIDRMLLQRHIHHEARKAGARMKGPKKRTEEDNTRFREHFTQLMMTNNTDESTA